MSGHGETGALSHKGDDQPPWMQPVDEDAAGVAEEGRLVRARGYLMVGLSILGLALFSVALWFLYQSQMQPREPIRVAAPEGPVRVAPEDRGGLQVAHRDVSVYDQVSGNGDGDRQQVAFRPGPETPADAPDAPRIALAGLEARPVVGAGASMISASYATAEPQDVSPAQDASGPPPVKDAVRAGRDDQWAVQIAAYRQERHARAFMAKSRTDHPDILGDLDGWVVRARKDMANYYRVRFGPLEDRETALATCQAIKDSGLNCLIIAPGS